MDIGSPQISNPSYDIPDTLNQYRPLQILLVEDSSEDAILLQQTLSEAFDASRYWLIHVRRLQKAIELAKKDQFDAVLLDLSLPDASGLESVKAMADECPHLPIVVLTGNLNPNLGVSAIRYGAQDFIIKGSVDGNRLSQPLKHAMERKNNDWVSSSSGVPTPRNTFYERLEQALAFSERNHKSMALFMLEVVDRDRNSPRSKAKNLPQELVHSIINRLQTHLRGSDFTDWLRGRQFAVVLGEIQSFYDCVPICRRFQENFFAPFELSTGELIHLRLRMGIGLSPLDATDISLIEKAETALDRLRKIDDGDCEFASKDFQLQLSNIENCRKILCRIADTKTFQFSLNPVMSSQEDHIPMVEFRWRWDELIKNENLSFEILTACLKNTLTSRKFYLQLLRTACSQMRSLYQSNIPDSTKVIIHFPANVLELDGFGDDILQSLAIEGFDPSQFAVLISEQDAYQPEERVLAAVEKLKGAGTFIILDRMGTGALSLNLLKRFPADVLKLDETMVVDLLSENSDLPMISGLIQIAHSLGLKVVATGVSNERSRNILTELGCDYKMGSLYGVYSDQDDYRSFWRTQGGKKTSLTNGSNGVQLAST